jgi:hypothetical protein
MHSSFVIFLPKTGIVEPEEMTIARGRLCNTLSLQRIFECNDRGKIVWKFKRFKLGGGQTAASE